MTGVCSMCKTRQELDEHGNVVEHPSNMGAVLANKVVCWGSSKPPEKNTEPS